MSQRKPCNAATYRKAVVDLCVEQKSRKVVEIGIYTGELSKLLLAIKTIEKLWLIDRWSAYAHYSQELMDRNYDTVCKMFKGDSRVEILRASSTTVDLPDESIDFVTIDGDHEEPAVREDIIWWREKLRPGGMMTGDNYEMSGVAAAVDALAPDRKLAAKGRVWWTLKS